MRRPRRCSAPLAAALLAIAAAPTAMTTRAPAATAVVLPLRHTVQPLQRIIVPVHGETRPLARQPRKVTTRSAPLKSALAELKAERTAKGELKLNLSADILFAFDSARIRPAAERALSRVALVIREVRPRRVRIEGHTDALGSDAYNLKLSLRRARAVRDWLVRRGGISARLLRVAGFGERRPVAPNRLPDGSDNPAGRRLNRRVEVILQPAPRR